MYDEILVDDGLTMCVVG